MTDDFIYPSMKVLRFDLRVRAWWGDWHGSRQLNKIILLEFAFVSMKKLSFYSLGCGGVDAAGIIHEE